MKTRRSYIYCVFALFLAAGWSCKKFVEKQKEQAAQSVITSGTWRVTKYQAADSDRTSAFAGYQFRFHENGTVDGVSPSKTSTGSWSVDIATRTILSSFPTNDSPVNLLNHTWRIKDSYNDSVSANAGADSALYLLELHKN